MAGAWTTGICVRKDRLEWTVLHRSKEGWKAERSGEAVFGEEGLTPEFLKKQGRFYQGWIALGLSTGAAMVKVSKFPSADPEELRGMAELHLDGVSPYALESMEWGAEIVGGEGEERQVAMAAAPTGAVEAAGGAFQSLRALPDRVDLNILGWWRSLQDAGLLEGGGDVAAIRVARGSDGTEALVLREGRPVWAGSWDAAPEGEEGLSAWAEGCAEEFGLALTGLEGEWGVGNSLRILVVEDEGMQAAGAALGAALAQAAGCGAEAVKEVAEGDGIRASEGLARRFLEPAEGLWMDLAPSAWGEMEEERRVKQGMLRSAAVFAACWLAGVGIFLTLLSVRRAQLYELEAEAEALEIPAREVRALRGKVLELAQYADRTVSPLECLRVVSEVMPDGVEMNSFVYNKGSDLKLRGEAKSASGVYDFVTALEETGMFPEVRNDGVNTRGGQNAYSLTVILPGGEGLAREGGEG